MNVLFLTLGDLENIEARGLYPDLLRKFRNEGHSVYIVTPRQRRSHLSTEYYQKDGVHILGVKVGNIKKCGMIEKGISTLLIESQYKNAIRKFFCGVTFDLILYTTPPITLANTIKYIKDRDHAKTYLLLKDIFPQNAVDLGMMSKSGLKSIPYKLFRRKEKQLYALSDRIGCMSPANVDFVLRDNPEISAKRVEVCPNSIEPVDMSISSEGREEIRGKYGIPLNKTVFIYGGNLGKPQGIPFLIDCLKSQKNNQDVFFLIVGSGTEYSKLENYSKNEHQNNFKLISFLPKEDYDRLAASCDVGMIFLDHRFTIPNFPSRLLAYMQAKLPVLCVTDPNTDVGRIAEENGFGWWCESNSVDQFDQKISIACSANCKAMGFAGAAYLEKYYTVASAYQIILNAFHKIQTAKDDLL